MTEKEYRKHNSDWFEGKKATVSRMIKNKGGEIITAGSEVELRGKSQKGGFKIKFANIHIVGVHPEDINLIEP